MINTQSLRCSGGLLFSALPLTLSALP